MVIHQISVFVENRHGRLSEILGVLADANIDLRAVSIADTTDFGILRMILTDPDRAIELFRQKGITASRTEVLAAELRDVPGSLHKVLLILGEAGISVEYVYAFITRKDQDAYVILRVEDNAQAAQVLTAAGIKLLNPGEVYGI